MGLSCTEALKPISSRIGRMMRRRYWLSTHACLGFWLSVRNMTSWLNWFPSLPLSIKSLAADMASTRVASKGVIIFKTSKLAADQTLGRRLSSGTVVWLQDFFSKNRGVDTKEWPLLLRGELRFVICVSAAVKRGER